MQSADHGPTWSLWRPRLRIGSTRSVRDLASRRGAARPRGRRDPTGRRWCERTSADRRSRHRRAERSGAATPAQPGRRPVVLWFRRDLRLSDHPALVEAARQGPIIALFVLDDALIRGAGQSRLAYLLRTLRVLDEQLARAAAHSLSARPTGTGGPAVARKKGDRGPHHCRLRALWRGANTCRGRPRLGAAALERLTVRSCSCSAPETRRRSVSGVHTLLPVVAVPRVGTPCACRSRFGRVVPRRRCAHPR